MATHLTHNTPLTFEYPDASLPSEAIGFTTTWGAFSAANADDPDMLADVVAQIAEHNYASIGGGASPLVWIFA